MRISLGLLCATLLGICPAAEVPKDFPLGDTADNAETSRAVDLIIRGCAEAYKTEEMVATGTVIYASKFDEEEEQYSRKVSLKWKAPDRATIETTSGTIRSVFNADGSRFTFINDESEEYAMLSQEAGLPAFSEMERAGELLQDFSGAVNESVVAPLLFSPNKLEWLHSGVEKYVYEGEEEVRGHQCWRVKFVQTNPDITIINWFDQETFLLRKVSIIQSMDEDGAFEESYSDGYVANMQIMIWDEISTRPGQLKATDFAVKIPSSFDEISTATVEESAEGFWSSLVRIAASDTPVSAPLLTRSAGNISFDFKPVATLRADIGAINLVPRKPGGPVQFVVALKGKGLAIARTDGATSMVLSQDDDWVLSDAVGSADDPLLVATGKNRALISAYSMSGEARWSYQLPRATLVSLKSDKHPTSPSLYALYDESHGIRRLAMDGTLLNATRRVDEAEALVYGDDAVYAINDEKIWSFTPDLKSSGSAKIRNQPGPISWAKGEKHPILCIARNDDEEVILQNWDTQGKVRWSMTIAEEGDDIDSGAVTPVVLKVDGKPTTCAAVVVDSGIILVADLNGRLLYKGRVKADEVAMKRTDNIVAANLHPADVDGDGIDELYTVSDRQIMQLKQED